MKKKILFLFFMVVLGALALGGVDASAATYGKLTYTISNGKATITDCNMSAKGNMVIPSTLGGYPVTSIAEWAFFNCRSLTSVTIPDSVTSIGDDAFSDCSSLTSATIPDSVTSIGNGAFSGCRSLTSATIPDSVTSIGDDAFSGCSSLTSVTIPDSVTSIGNSTFSSCSQLTSVTISDSVVSIGNSAFSSCVSLASIYYTGTDSQWSSISIESDNAYLTSAKRYYEVVEFYIENGLEYAICKNNAVLKSMQTTVSGKVEILKVVKNVPVTSIGGGAFWGCSKLTSVTIPDGVTSIGDYAFCYCSSLTSVTIPDGVTSIGYRAFYNCSKLTSVTIPDSVTSLGSSAFYGCSSLTSVTIPDNVTSIGDGVFYDCSNLASIYYKGTETEWNSIIVGDYNTVLTKANIYYEVEEVYKENDIEYMIYKDYAVLKSAQITISGEIEIPKLLKGVPVTKIDKNAFFNCSSLTNIIIPDNVTNIEDDAFFGCSSLNKVYYMGTKDEWSNINIGSGNSNLMNNVKFYAYVTLVSEDGEKIVISEINKLFDMALIQRKYGYDTEVYCDAEYKTLYDSFSNVTENMALYVKYVEMKNALEITGAKSAVVGESGIIRTGLLTTLDDAEYLLCTVKFPDVLTLENVIAKDFKYVSEDSRVTEKGFTAVTFICQYADNGGIPVKTEVSPFELVFSISKDADVQTVEIGITNDSILIGENDYTFDVIKNSSLEILPKLAEEIEISGGSTISVKTQYKATVYPDYTTNKEVIWSVDDSTVAMVDDDGVVTPLKSGTIVLTATAKDGSDVVGTKTVNTVVYAKIDSLKTSDGMWDKAFDKDIYEYVVYVNNDVSSVNITPSFTGGGTLKYNNSTTMINNRVKSVTLTNDETVITLNRSGVTDCTNSEYKITFIKDSEKYCQFVKTQTTTQKTDKGTSFTVSSAGLLSGDVVCLAVYEENRLQEVLYQVYEGESLIFETDKAYDAAKVMVVDSIDTMKPLAIAEEVE